MISFVRRRWIVLSLGAIVLLSLGTLNYSGMCISERRYLTDQEKFRKFVSHVIRNVPGRGYVENNTGDRNIQKVIPYRTADEFFKTNPNCCEFGPTAGNGIEPMPAPSLVDRALGKATDVIVRRYLIRYIDAHGHQKSFEVGGQTWADSCGRYVKWH